MKRNSLLGAFIAVAMASSAFAQEYLVRLSTANNEATAEFVAAHGGRLELVSREGSLFKWTTERAVNTHAIASRDANVVYVSKNRTYSLLQNPSFAQAREAILRMSREGELPQELFQKPAATDPEIKTPTTHATGADPLLKDAWGIFKVGADKLWAKSPMGANIVVAVTDTGVDYNHVDLINNMWRNDKEIPNNGKDDDNNGYVDDIVGWDFAAKDNKPFDTTLSLMEILFQGGNPGHGTHVAGVVGAMLKNAKGTAGVAPNVRIMAMRFITEKGQGSLADAVGAIDYAVANGAHIINASWGGEKDSEDDTPLREAIQRAESKGVIFVAAAGNGRVKPGAQAAEGFNNDTDPKPMVPASFEYGNVFSVAASNSSDDKAPFSNFGPRTTKIAAPGVKILSTIPGDKWQDTVVDLGSIKATWDGTSMAAPFVAGAMAVVWSINPEQSYKAVQDTILGRAAVVPALKNLVATDGRLDLRGLAQ